MLNLLKINFLATSTQFHFRLNCLYFSIMLVHSEGTIEIFYPHNTKTLWTYESQTKPMRTWKKILNSVA